MADLIPLRRTADDPMPDEEVIGGKAAGLVRLLGAGLPAPDGVVVPVGHPDLEAAAAEVRARLGGASYAVRSSALEEDGAEISLAGAFATRLRVPPDGLADAVAEVRHAAGRGPIPVLVMRHIEPDVGGVAFSTDPVAGGLDCVIASTTGHHAAITDGTSAGAEQRVSASGRVRGRGPLTSAQARAVAAVTRRAADLLGTAADVEFAVVADAVLLLQARALTSFPVWEAPPGVWEHSAEYSVAPGAPVLQQLMADGQTDGFRQGFAEAGAMVDRIELHAIGGYMYGQVAILGVPPQRPASHGGPPPAALIGLLSRLHPAQRARCARARRFLLEDGPSRASERTAAIDWDGIAGEAAAAADPIALEADLGASLTTIVGSFGQLFRAHFRWIATAYSQLVGAAGRGLEASGVAHADAVRIVAGPPTGAWTDRLGGLVRVAAAAIAADPGARAALDAADLPADRVLADLLARDDDAGTAVRDLLSRVGVVCLGYDVTVPTLGEQPDVLVQALRQQATGPPPAAEGSRSTTAEALLAGVPAWLHDGVRAAWQEHQQRDRHSLALQTLLGALRLALLEAGRRLQAAALLDDAEDVLYLHWEEVSRWARTGALDPTAGQAAAARRRRLRQLARLRPPAVIGGTPSEPPDLRHLPRAARAVGQRMAWHLAIAFGEGPTAPADGPRHTGRPASPGAVEGIARIVHGPHDGVVLRPGEIMVCPFTMAVWTSLLQQCAGVVTETGGPLSHAAIVARELGVPAVCGVPDATRTIPDGARIRVDGDRGTVEVLSA